jgi:CheY-like chemotaxis protein
MHAELISAGLRALIVEDEALIADELTERLSRLGFAVIGSVDSAEESIAIASSEHPDLILMDIRLKGKKDGIEACQEIRRRMDVPIVYLTAYSDQRTVERAKRTEHDGFVLKPFQQHELQSTIEVALKRYAARAKQKMQ